MRSGKTVSIVRQAYKDKFEDRYAVWAGNLDDLTFADWHVKPTDLTVENVIEWRDKLGFPGISVVIPELATWFNSYNFKAESSQSFGLFAQQTSKGHVHLLYDTVRPNHGIKRLRDLTHYFVFCDRVVYDAEGNPHTAKVEDYTAKLRQEWTVEMEDGKFKPVSGFVIEPEDYGQYFEFFDTWRLQSK